jgi:hypothetical protein
MRVTVCVCVCVFIYWDALFSRFMFDIIFIKYS